MSDQPERPRAGSVYDHPHPYEIAFAFRDVECEVDFLESAIGRFSTAEVRQVLELASGTSPYLEELSRRGYRYAGLDVNGSMLEYVRQRAERAGIEAELFDADMIEFSLGSFRCEVAFVLLGSFYPTSNRELMRHLDAVARVLAEGGLYVLDGVVRFDVFENRPSSWEWSEDGTTITTTYLAEPVDSVAQTYNEYLRLEVDRNGEVELLESRVLHKAFFPQEFLSLVEAHGRFEFVGWFKDFDLETAASPGGRQQVVLRKRASAS